MLVVRVVGGRVQVHFLSLLQAASSGAWQGEHSLFVSAVHWNAVVSSTSPTQAHLSSWHPGRVGAWQFSMGAHFSSEQTNPVSEGVGGEPLLESVAETDSAVELAPVPDGLLLAWAVPVAVGFPVCGPKHWPVSGSCPPPVARSWIRRSSLAGGVGFQAQAPSELTRSEGDPFQIPGVPACGYPWLTRCQALFMMYFFSPAGLISGSWPAASFGSRPS